MWKYYLVLTLLCIAIQALFSMLEMAAVSFNKLRLQYYVGLKKKRAIWLSSLLKNPTRLFGTTLIFINAALQFGSEFSRRFYDSLGLNPDLAPFTQVIVVLIFAELSPMFAARRYAENVIMLGVWILYISSKIIYPLIWLLDLICKFIHLLLGVKTQTGLTISREELQKAIESRDDTQHFGEQKDFDVILSNIFTLKSKSAKELMEPIEKMKLISSKSSISELRKMIGLEYIPFLPIYHRVRSNIVGIAYPRDLIRHDKSSNVHTYAKSPWFISDKTPSLQLLKDFRRNNQTLAVVLNSVGVSVGILSLDTLIDEIFGQKDNWLSLGDSFPNEHKVFLDCSFPASTLIKDINDKFHLNIQANDSHSLEDLMEEKLNSNLEEGMSIRIDHLEFTVESVSLLGAKKITLKSISD